MNPSTAADPAQRLTAAGEEEIEEKTMKELAPTSGASKALVATAGEVAARATASGVTITFLGYQPLFSGVRVYAGIHHDWVLASAADDPLIRRGELAIPKAELRTLRRMLDAGLDCQAVYLAHEIPKGRLVLQGQAHALVPGIPQSIDPATGERVVDRVPVPPRTVAIARHVGNTAGALLTVLAAARIVGRGTGRAAHAATAAGIRAATAAVQGLDPVVFGAWTAGQPPQPGVPAAFFELVRFTY
jgi:hypothetical protein